MPDGQDRSQKLRSYGWMLFVVCNLFFIANAVIYGSALAIKRRAYSSFWGVSSFWWRCAAVDVASVDASVH